MQWPCKDYRPILGRVKLLRQIPVLIVVLAVLALSTAWATHRHKQDLAPDSNGAEHCELCLQIGRGAAPAPAATTLLVVATGWTLWLALTLAAGLAPRPSLRSQQARAPPR